ncbi:MAG: TetR/AcrR family transcriptional regulator [Oscillochloridaceae bacterium umkhey_bin13]
MSPRTAAQNQALRDESRERIVEAALQLFAEHGYERTSVKQIAATAGVAQGLLYSHFVSKEALLRAIFEQSVADVQESFARAAAGQGSPVERQVRAAFAVLQEREAFWRLSYGVRLQRSVVAALGNDLHDWTAQIRTQLEAAFHERGSSSPSVEAAVLFALIDGVAQHYLLDPANYPLEAVMTRIVKLIEGQ